jgi:hypothetical protein
MQIEYQALLGERKALKDMLMLEKEKDKEIAMLRAALQEIKDGWCTAGVNELVDGKSCAHCIAHTALGNTEEMG